MKVLVESNISIHIAVLICYIKSQYIDKQRWIHRGGGGGGGGGVKNIIFFGEICCSRTIFARVFKVEIVLWY